MRKLPMFEGADSVFLLNSPWNRLSRGASHLRMVAAIILLVFGQRTMIGAEREVDPPAVVPQASVADHFVIGQRQLVAVDLLRGRRVWGLAVRRTWRPTMARSKHFGPGWSDSNDVQIVKLADQKLSVWRGGLLLTIARRADDSSEDAPGHRIVHDADGWAMQFNDDVLRFRDDGKLTLWKSPARDLTFHYDDQARLARVQASDAQFLNYHYDEDRVIRIEGPKSLIARYEYDGEGRLAQVVNGWNRRTRYSYSDDRMQVVATDDSGRRTASPEFIVAGVDAGELPEAQTSKAAPTARRLSSAAGDSTEVDELGRVTAVTLPSGNVERTEYNKWDQPTRRVYPDGSWDEYAYNDAGRQVGWKSSNGRWRSWTFDQRGRVDVVRFWPNQSANCVYDNDHRLTALRFSQGSEVRFGYDEQGRLTREAWSSGQTRIKRFNESDQVVEFSDGRLTRHVEFDERGILKSVRDEVYGELAIDATEIATGRVTARRNGGKLFSLQVNQDGKIATLEYPGGQTLSRLFGGDGWPSLVTSPSGRTWRYQRDQAGRLTGIQFPADRSIALERDDAGRVTQLIRRGVLTREYLRDGQGRVRLKSTPLGMAAANTYDADGFLQQMVLPEGRVSFEQDDFGFVQRIQGPNYEIRQEHRDDGTLAKRIYEPAEIELSLPVDEQGRAAGISLTDLKVGYEYDELGSISKLQLPGSRAIEFSRDSAGRLTKATLPNGHVIGVGYDEQNRITILGAADPQRRVAFLERYQYSDAGNLEVLQADGRPPVELQYDADDRLVGAAEPAPARFTYNADDDITVAAINGQRVDWVLNQHGQLDLRNDFVKYEWDDAGNLRSADTSHVRVANQFDAAGRLEQRALGPVQWRFGYLPDGDRLWQEGPDGRTWYVYLPAGLVGMKDTEGTIWVVVRWPDSGRPLAICSSTGVTLYAIADRLGSVRRWVGEDGVVVARRDYGHYGLMVEAEGASPLDLYAGMVYDTHGLCYARRRYYDPLICRFISLDPWLGASIFPASHHGYAYAANNPYRYRDPHGTAPGKPKPDGEYALGADLLEMAVHYDVAKETGQEANAAINQTLQWIDGVAAILSPAATGGRGAPPGAGEFGVPDVDPSELLRATVESITQLVRNTAAAGVGSQQANSPADGGAASGPVRNCRRKSACV